MGILGFLVKEIILVSARNVKARIGIENAEYRVLQMAEGFCHHCGKHGALCTGLCHNLIVHSRLLGVDDER